MSGPPTSDELVGTPLAAGERERLLRVHELLIEAGAPTRPRNRVSADVVPLRPRRRRAALVAIAAALGLGLFAAGWGGRSGRAGTFEVVP